VIGRRGDRERPATCGLGGAPMNHDRAADQAEGGRRKSDGS
jgi:hypothetical protein